MRDVGAERLGLIEPLDLGHDQLGFGRLGVRDVDGVTVSGRNVRQFLRQGLGGEVQAAAGQARLTGPLPGSVQLRWQPLRLTTVAGALPRVQTQGTLQGLPMAWVDALGTEQAAPPATPAAPSPTTPALAPQALLTRLGLATDILLEGQWNVDTTESLRATASLRRTQGDLRILSAEPPAETTSVSTGQGLGPGSVTTITPATATKPAATAAGAISQLRGRRDTGCPPAAAATKPGAGAPLATSCGRS